MANSARAYAHAPTPGIDSDDQAHPTPNVAALPHRPARAASSWALEVSDDVANLHDVLQAYVGLEKLLSPAKTSDCKDVAPQRHELGALVRLVNEALAQRLEATEATVSSLRESLATQGRAA